MIKTINNNIQEIYCSFEISKLLKEKGFDCGVIALYDKNGFHEYGNVPYGMDHSYNSSNKKDEICSPTHALVIEWIRVNFDIWISVDYTKESKWFYNIVLLSEDGGNIKTNFNSQTEAYSEAIEYTLKNLI